MHWDWTGRSKRSLVQKNHFTGHYELPSDPFDHLSPVHGDGLGIQDPRDRAMSEQGQTMDHHLPMI